MSQSNYFNVLLYTAVVFHTVVITVSFATAVDLLQAGKTIKEVALASDKKVQN